jgi:Malonyl-CoA decarboxylase C-terminal domain
MNQVHHFSRSTRNPRVATFYSISNLQPAPLTGIGLGEYLIKEVVPILKAELASLDTFVTLSPMPGFRQWLQGVAAASAHHSDSKFAQTPQELLSLNSNDSDKVDDASSLLESLAQYLDCPTSEALDNLVNLLASSSSSCWKSQPPVVHQVLERLAAR